MPKSSCPLVPIPNCNGSPPMPNRVHSALTEFVTLPLRVLPYREDHSRTLASSSKYLQPVQLQLLCGRFTEWIVIFCLPGYRISFFWNIWGTVNTRHNTAEGTYTIRVQAGVGLMTATMPNTDISLHLPSLDNAFRCPKMELTPWTFWKFPFTSRRTRAASMRFGHVSGSKKNYATKWAY